MNSTPKPAQDGGKHYELAWLDELIFLKLGLDLTRTDTQYPLIPAADLAEFRRKLVEQLQEAETKARLDELENVRRHKTPEFYVLDRLATLKKNQPEAKHG